MKQHKCLWLCVALIMLLGMTSASAFTSYSEYTIPGDYYTPFSPTVGDNGDLFYHAWGDKDRTVGEHNYWHLLWYKDNQIWRDFPYKTGSNTEQPWSWSVFMPTSDGQCRVILPLREEGVEIYDWTQDGMKLLNSLPGKCEWVNVRAMKYSTALYDEKSGTLYVVDETGATVLQLALDVQPADQGESGMYYGHMIRAVGSPEEFAVLIRVPDRMNQFSIYHMYCIRDGKVAWKRDFRNGVEPMCPGDGYFYYSEKISEDDNYSPYRIVRVDENGNDQIKRTLSAKKLVLGAGLTMSNDGKLMLLGKAVANSRKEYTAFTIMLDDNMKAQSLDVREFNCGDYGYSMLKQSDGSFWLFDTAGIEPILVPYDVLPVTGSHGIDFK